MTLDVPSAVESHLLDTRIVSVGCWNDAALPVVVGARDGPLDLTAWARSNRNELDALVRRHGGILFRAFDVIRLENFATFADVFISRHMDYSFAITPRTKVSATVATASEHPPHEIVPLHGEMDAQREWPRTILFYCQTPPRIAKPGSSGETPIADARRILARLSPVIRDRFEALGIRYVRNLTGRRAIEFVFGTTDRDEITAYCAKRRYDVTFSGDDRVRTEHVSHAIVSHPVTGERVWFNHAQIYHLSSLPSQYIRDLYSVEDGDPLPMEAYYGDGSPIDRSVMREVRRAYHAETVAFHWNRGDILLLDNMLVAHGRRPFEGERRILTAMGNPTSDAIGPGGVR